MATIFHQDRINKYCSIITDLDTSILELPADEDDDDDEQKACRNSEISGKQRKAILDKFAEDNDYVNVFYAENTFEVQFLQQGNESEIMAVVKSNYTKPKDIDRIKEKIDSADIKIYGKEVLRLANKFGKGWFALLVSEQLTHKTKIPDYIIEAIAFAEPELNISTLKSICTKRFTALFNDPFDDDKVDYKSLIRKVNAVITKKELVSLLKDQVPGDDLTKFISA